MTVDTLNISNFETKKVKKMNYIFKFTLSLKLLDISNFKIGPHTETNYIFYGTNPWLDIRNKKQYNKFLDLYKKRND